MERDMGLPKQNESKDKADSLAPSITASTHGFTTSDLNGRM